MHALPQPPTHCMPMVAHTTCNIPTTQNSCVYHMCTHFNPQIRPANDTVTGPHMALCRLRTLRAALYALPQPLNIACAWQHTPHATSPRLRCPCHAPAREPPWGTTTHVHGWSPIAVRQCPHCTPKLKSPAYDRIHYRMHTHDSDTMQYTMQHTLHYHITPKRKALPGRAHCSLTPPVPLPAHLTANPYQLHMSACITSYIHMP